MKQKHLSFLIPYLLWIILFVIAPLVLILGYSLTDAAGHFTLHNFVLFFSDAVLFVSLARLAFCMPAGTEKSDESLLAACTM